MSDAVAEAVGRGDLDELVRALDRPVVAGALDCVGPLGEFNGDAYVDLRGLRFSGVGDWNAT